MDINELMSYAIDKYRENAGLKEEKNIILNKAISYHLPIDGISLKQVYESILYSGDVLEESLESQSYIALIRTGAFNACDVLVVVMLNHDGVYFIAYAKEGLIKQHLAQTAIDKVAERIKIFGTSA